MTTSVNGQSASKRKALVTGGSGGIGSAIVRQLCQQGMEVTFLYNSGLTAAHDVCVESGAVMLPVDFTSDWQPPDLRVDVLVNAAGVNLSGNSVISTSYDEINASMNVNFHGPHRLICAYAPWMIDQHWGRIININSLWGSSTAPNRLSYAASKHALRALTSTVALELAQYGVSVNEVCPGAVDTAMLRTMAKRAVEDGKSVSVEAYVRSCAEGVPIGRLVSCESVASIVGYLASEHSGDIVGQSISVDGGI